MPDPYKPLLFVQLGLTPVSEHGLVSISSGMNFLCCWSMRVGEELKYQNPARQNCDRRYAGSLFPIRTTGTTAASSFAGNGGDPPFPLSMPWVREQDHDCRKPRACWSPR